MRNRRRSPWPVWLVVVAFVAGWVLNLAIAVVRHELFGIRFGLAARAIEADACLLLAAYFVLRRRERLTANGVGLRPARPRRAAALALAALVAISVFDALYNSAIHPRHWFDLFATSRSLSTGGAIALLLVTAFVVPTVEEVFFRGVLYRALRARLALWPAALVGGALFGLVHLGIVGGHPAYEVPALAFAGVVFCLLYEATGSLLPGIVVHSFIDTIGAEYAVTGAVAVTTIVWGAVILLFLVDPVDLATRASERLRARRGLLYATATAVVALGSGVAAASMDPGRIGGARLPADDSTIAGALSRDVLRGRAQLTAQVDEITHSRPRLLIGTTTCTNASEGATTRGADFLCTLSARDGRHGAAPSLTFTFLVSGDTSRCWNATERTIDIGNGPRNPPSRRTLDLCPFD